MFKNNISQDPKNKIASIAGCVSDEEADFLYQLAKKCSGKGAIVEIGSWKGKSTICLGLGSQNGAGASVYAIDPHTGSPDHHRHGKTVWTFDEFSTNIKNAGLEAIIKPILATSEEAAKNWNEPIELIFIDANYHDYELSKKDLELWSKHLVTGGIYALHNTAPSISGIIMQHIPLHGCAAPRKVANELIFGSRNFRKIVSGGTIIAAEKCQTNTLADQIFNQIAKFKNDLKYLMHDIYIALTVLPDPVKRLAKKLFLIGS